MLQKSLNYNHMNGKIMRAAFSYQSMNIQLLFIYLPEIEQY